MDTEDILEGEPVDLWIEPWKLNTKAVVQRYLPAVQLNTICVGATLYWDVTQRMLVDVYWRFGTPCVSHLEGQAVVEDPGKWAR